MKALTIPVARPLFEWRLRTRSLLLGERTMLMAIVNLTPDSFSGDGQRGGSMGAASGNKMAVGAALEAIDGGADILDLGAESTRPGAEPLSGAEEQERLLPVLEAVLAARPGAIVSIDTYHAATARVALKMGAEIVNDVSGLAWDNEMADAVAQTGAGLVLMHTRGKPAEWQEQASIAPVEVLPLVFAGLMERLTMAEATHIDPERILVDPGFGFGKRGAENLTLLAGLGRLHELGRPLLAGVSRKGFLGEVVGRVQDGATASIAEARRTATLAAQTAAVLAGAHVLRVHEVQAAREACAVADAVLAAGEELMYDQ